jgi:hypothetical protein
MTRKPSTGNQGIQANTVTAEVMAVGYRAQATKTVAAVDHDSLARAITQLGETIDRLGLAPAPRALLEKDVKGLTQATSGPKPDPARAKTHLEGIVEKLGMVGTVVKDVAGLVEPMTKIAGLLHIPLAFLTGL